VTYEVLSEGRKIADSLGTELTAVVLGSGVEAAAGALGTYGADKVLVADHPALAELITAPYTNVIAEIAGKQGAAVIVIGASAQGKDLAARLAAKLNAGLAMDCVAVRLEGDNVAATRPMYGGKVLADVVLAGNPRIVATRPNAMSIVENPKAGAV
jgi:electron transfer flavoprotein alpha subunit